MNIKLNSSLIVYILNYLHETILDSIEMPSQVSPSLLPSSTNTEVAGSLLSSLLDMEPDVPAC